MKFCMDHWTALRAAIEARGLSALVADTSEEVASKMVSETTSGPSIDNFDPLMGAHMAIVSNAIGLAGLAVMMPNEDGSDRCPLCFLTKSHAEGCTDPNCTVTTYDHWIDRAADDALAEWKRRGAA